MNVSVYLLSKYRLLSSYISLYLLIPSKLYSHQSLGQSNGAVGIVAIAIGTNLVGKGLGDRCTANHYLYLVADAGFLERSADHAQGKVAVAHALLAGAGVGLAGIDEDAAHAFSAGGFEVGLRHEHRGGLEKVGGELNAYTTKEETVLHSTVLAEDISKAIDLLFELAFTSTFPQKELEKERDVVLDEIVSY